MKDQHLRILQHSLGLDEYGRGSMYRNHYCAGGDSEADCRELVSMGLMTEHPRTTWLPYYNCSVTEEGKMAVRDNSPTPPKQSRSKQRYKDFLNSDCGLRFIEWLRIKPNGVGGSSK